MADFHDLEDDIELPPAEIAHVEQPRKLSRLKKKTIDENKTINSLKGVETPESEIHGFRPDKMLADEENEAEDSPEDNPKVWLGSKNWTKYVSHIHKHRSGNIMQDEPSQNNPGGAHDERIQEGEEEDEEEQQEGKEAAGVWDEEDEIEKYFREKSENGRGGEESDSDGSGSESDEDYDSGAAAKQLGDNPSAEDLAAETQRILRGKLIMES